MQKFKVSNGEIYYIVDGGGKTYGINALANKTISQYLKKGNILEMCSGAGFMGFYLNFQGYCDNLTLIDIDNNNYECVSKTITENNITNTKFVTSDVFNDYHSNEIFDTIVINPPHFKYPKSWGHTITKYQKQLTEDKDLNIHRRFLNDAPNYMNQDSRIIMVENSEGITQQDIYYLSKDKLEITLIHFDKQLNYGWTNTTPLYVAVLKLR